MLIKEAQFERSELIVEMAKVHEVFVQMKVRLAAFHPRTTEQLVTASNASQRTELQALL